MVAKSKKQLHIIAYDTTSDKRRRQIVKCLEKYGVRINKSVFECMLTKKQIAAITAELEKISNMRYDSIAIYPICAECYLKTRYIPEYKRVMPEDKTIVL